MSCSAAEALLLSLHFNTPHWPWEGPEDSALGTQGALFDGGSLDVYARMMESMDQNIGRLPSVLEALGIAENTIVVFTSDNGGERLSVDTMERANRAKAEPAMLALARQEWDGWNAGMVTDDSITGLCNVAANVGEPLSNTPEDNCRKWKLE